MKEIINQNEPGMENSEPMEEAANNDYEWPENEVADLEPGQIIEAKVILVRDDMAFVDIGGKSDYTIPLAELSTVPINSAREAVKPGETIKVMVTGTGDGEKFTLSKRRADEAKIWLQLKESFDNQGQVSGTVIGLTKGGLNIDLGGAKAFMPASHATLGQQNLEALIGKTLEMKIIEFDLEKRRVLVSRKSMLEEERRKLEETFFRNLKEGERRKGKVSRIADFGAFVDLGSGIEGLIHVSELSWNRVKSPRELLKEGDEVEVLVTKVDPASKRISLSLKQIQEHPWFQAVQNFSENNVYPGTVVRIEPFGAFIRLAPGVEGLAHISQLADKRVSNPGEVLNIGQEVQAKVLKIDRINRKVSLSLKQVATDCEEQELNQFLERQDDRPFVQSLGDFIKRQ